MYHFLSQQNDDVKLKNYIFYVTNTTNTDFFNKTHSKSLIKHQKIQNPHKKSQLKHSHEFIPEIKLLWLIRSFRYNTTIDTYTQRSIKTRIRENTHTQQPIKKKVKKARICEGLNSRRTRNVTRHFARKIASPQK